MKRFNFMKKFVTFAIATSMILSSNMVALADVSMSSEGESSTTSPSEFDVDDKPSGIVVRVPANLDLTFTEELDTYQITADVGVYGEIKDYGEVSVSIDEDIVYSTGLLVAGEVPSGDIDVADSTVNEYPYSYRYRWSEIACGSSSATGDDVLTQWDITLVSKTPVCLVRKTNDANTGTATYGLYVFNNGDLAEITCFSTSDNRNFNQYTYSDTGSTATPISSQGHVRCTNIVCKKYNSSNSITESSVMNDGRWYSHGVTVTPFATSPTYGEHINAYNLFMNTYGFKTLECSDKVFDSVLSAKNYFTYDPDDQVYANGKVRFGENTDGICTESWNSNQVLQGSAKEEDGVTLKTDANGKFVLDEENIDNRTIMINVPSYEVSEPGTYYATAEFSISFSCIGQRSNIGAATKLANRGLVQTGDGYTWDNTYAPSVDYMYLNRLHTEADNSPMDIAPSTIADNPSWQTIKYVQLADNETPLYYHVDDTSAVFCSSWLMGMKGVQVLVIPSTFEKQYLHTSDAGVVSYDTTEVFEDTNKKIGNALVFAKNIDAAGHIIYVPHICYRGTKDQWKSLSGSTNWVFGNAGNIVTVHCTDGVLFY